MPFNTGPELAPDTSDALMPAVDSKVAERLKKFEFVLDADLPPLQADRQWWSRELSAKHQAEMSDKGARWLEPFVTGETAKLPIFDSAHAKGPVHADRLAIGLRTKIRWLKRHEQPYADLLRALYGICILQDFTRSLKFDLASTSDLIVHVDIQELRAVACDYASLGYSHCKSLAKTDIKWLAGEFGEPNEHRSIESGFKLAKRNAIRRYCWSKLRQSEFSKVAGKDLAVSIRDWLKAQVSPPVVKISAPERMPAERFAPHVELDRLASEAVSIIAGPFVVGEIFTTSLNPDVGEIIEIVAIKLGSNAAVIGEFCVLIMCSKPIPVQVTALIGASQEILRSSGLALHDAMAQFLGFVGLQPIFYEAGAFNAQFLRESVAATGQCLVAPIFDTKFLPKTQLSNHGKAYRYVPETAKHGTPLFTTLTQAFAALAKVTAQQRDGRRRQNHGGVQGDSVGFPHWQPSGLFETAVVGTSYYDDTLAEIARNPAGQTALVYCAASLVPEDTNVHDANAVMVQIDGKKIGYLAREYAVLFRGYFPQFRIDMQPTTCDAVISNGLCVGGRQCSYSVDLDISPFPGCPGSISKSYPSPIRVDTTPVFLKHADGRYFVECWLSRDAYEDFNALATVDSWTTDEWSNINYYLPNKYGIGAGYRLLSVEKPMHNQLFGDEPPEVRIEDSRARTVLLSMSLVSADGR